MSKTIQKVFGLESPKPYTTNKAVPYESADPQLLFGIEMEIEYANADWEVDGITVTNDGSLRNGGLEFITRPMTYSHQANRLEAFRKKTGPLSSDHLSERTSVHVHANCLDMTIEQVQCLCLLYQVFERTLFEWCGPERADNIFCVPWSQTIITYNVIPRLIENPAYASSWQKYTALNLLPLVSQGTVEFRHMPGEGNVERILAWLRIISCLFAYAKNNPIKEVEKTLLSLNTTSAYRAMLNSVFGKEESLLDFSKNSQYIEEGVIALKYALLTTETKSKAFKPVATELPAHQPQENFIDWHLPPGGRRQENVNTAINDPWGAAFVAREAGTGGVVIERNEAADQRNNQGRGRAAAAVPARNPVPPQRDDLTQQAGRFRQRLAQQRQQIEDQHRADRARLETWIDELQHPNWPAANDTNE